MFRPSSLLVPALALLLAPSPAAAQAKTNRDEADYQVVGQTPVICTLTNAGAGATGLVNFRSIDRNVFEIDQMVSQASLSTQAASFELTLSGVCNSAHVIRLESLNNGLWQLSQIPATRPQGFGTAVPYEVSARWSDQLAQLSADAGVRETRRLSVPVANPASGNLTLHFEIRQGATNLFANAPIIAGSYTDTLTVVLEPQQ